MFTIVENGTPRWASKNALAAHTGVPYPSLMIWSEAQRNAVGVYDPVIVREPLDDYQDHDSGTLSFDGSKVTATYAAVNLSLERAKERAKQYLRQKFRQVRDGKTTATLGQSQFVLATTNDAWVELSGAVERTAGGSSVRIVTRAGDRLNMSNAQAQAAKKAVENHYAAASENEYDLDEAIDNASDLAALRAIDLEAGWPPNPNVEG